jgi:pilus assembly protein Flp/PilA
MKTISAFLRDQSGATAIEYALIAGGISIVVIGTVALIGEKVGDMWTGVSEDVSAAIDG